MRLMFWFQQRETHSSLTGFDLQKHTRCIMCEQLVFKTHFSLDLIIIIIIILRIVHEVQNKKASKHGI